MVDLITDSLRSVVAGIRRVHDEVDREDPSTSDLLHGIVVETETQAWMLGAENRTA